MTVYRFPNNALIPSDVIKPSVLIKLWRLSKVKLHETEMVQTYIQCILFFCPEQLSSNHKQWVWITHYRRRVSLEMAFCFRSDPNRWTNSEVGNFMSKYFEPKGRLFLLTEKHLLEIHLHVCISLWMMPSFFGISPRSQMQNICHVILFIGLRSHKSPLAQ